MPEECVVPTNLPTGDKKKYQIKIHSCKKDTNVTFFLSESEYLLLAEIAVATQLSSKTECEPTMFVTPVGKLTVNKKEGKKDV